MTSRKRRSLSTAFWAVSCGRRPRNKRPNQRAGQGSPAFFTGGAMEQRVFSVTEVNQYIKQLIDDVPQLNELLIRGELSNYKIYPSGHHYFTLKDGESAIRCVMFRS